MPAKAEIILGTFSILTFSRHLHEIGRYQRLDRGEKYCPNERCPTENTIQFFHFRWLIVSYAVPCATVTFFHCLSHFTLHPSPLYDTRNCQMSPSEAAVILSQINHLVRWSGARDLNLKKLYGQAAHIIKIDRWLKATLCRWSLA